MDNTPGFPAGQYRITVIFTPSVTLRSSILSTGLALSSRSGYWEGRPTAMPADLAVIGLGHLGLPLAQAAVATGIATIGYDPVRATDLAAAGSRRRRRGNLTAADIRRMLSGGFRPTGDPVELGRVRTAVICAPAPSARTAPSTSRSSPTPRAPSPPVCAPTPR